MLNKLNIEVAKFASDSEFRPAITGLLITGEKTVATDSFRLVEITRPVKGEHEPLIVNAKELLKKVKIPKGGDIVELHELSSVSKIYEKFPDYEKVIPTGEPKAEFSVNGLFLAEIAKLLGKVNGIAKINIKVYGPGDPIVIEAKNDEQSARALLMPLRS